MLRVSAGLALLFLMSPIGWADEVTFYFEAEVESNAPNSSAPARVWLTLEGPDIIAGANRYRSSQLSDYTMRLYAYNYGAMLEFDNVSGDFDLRFAGGTWQASDWLFTMTDSNLVEGETINWSFYHWVDPDDSSNWDHHAIIEPDEGIVNNGHKDTRGSRDSITKGWSIPGFGPRPPAFEPEYSFQMLYENFDYEWTGQYMATGINDSGEVVGHFSAGDVLAFVDEHGAATELPQFGPPVRQPPQLEAPGAETIATAINEAGQIAGHSREWDNKFRGFLYNNGTMTKIQPPANSLCDEIFFLDINNHGDMVGYCDEPNASEPLAFKAHAVLFKDGVVSLLGTLGGDYSVANAINDAGEIVGWANDGTNNRAFHYQDGVMTDLGTFGGPTSEANDINELGQIVGSAHDGAQDKPFIYENGSMSGLSLPWGWDVLGAPQVNYATAINDLGQIVGGPRHFIFNDGQMHYMHDIWVNSGMLHVINATPTAPQDINNRGEIVGRLGPIYAYNDPGYKITPKITPITVGIDVMPGDASNTFDPESNSVLEVAVITTALEDELVRDFDATNIDSATVALGPSAANASAPTATDADGDGDIDLSMEFIASSAGIACEDTEVTLTGQTTDGRLFNGTDSITTDCVDASCHP